MSEYRLKSEQLSCNCNFELFNFTTTAELEGQFEVIGQDRALEALNFGLNLKQKGYNIYVLNFSGTEERDYIIKKIKETAAQEQIPPDLCYVHNFNSPTQPLLLKLPAGRGREFKQEIESKIEAIKDEVNNLFTSEKYNKQKREIKKEYQQQTKEILTKIKVEAKEMGYLLIKEEEGFSITPLSDDQEAMSEEEYNNLTLEQQEEIDHKVSIIEDKIELVFDRLDDLEAKYETKLAALNNKLVKEIVENKLENLYQSFANLDKVVSYLDDLKLDLLNNIDQFKEEEQSESVILFTEEKEEDFSQYEVNLIVDNSSLKGAPVIKEDNPTYYNLLGRVEYENLQQGLKTNFKKIKAGSLQQANGGYLILEAEKLLSNFKAWPLLKQVLKSEQIKMENLGTEYEQLPIATLLPQKLAANIKVIIIGCSQLYYLLQCYDDEFKELFKIKADFSTEMSRNHANIYKLAQFISYKCSQEGLLDLNHEAVAKVIEYCSRQAENKNKLEINYSVVTDLLVEANLIASKNEQQLITAAEIEQVQQQRKYWNNKYESKLQEFYKNNKILINTTGAEIGMVNALSIIDVGDYSFGRPTRITAVAYKGEEGIINIEREINTSGKIHDKGVMILESYVGQNFAQEINLNLSARICFEQLYSEIDGDSASSAELYALLSALAEVPLKQGIAVTGSINQKGVIQPVGGVIDKIEGFFSLCQLKGLSGEQGVIIPQQNEDDLMLSSEVIRAVAEDKFNIYTISNVSEGLEILTATEQNVNELVQQKMNKWAE
ncbi:Lon protease family protein [Halanaerobacter jeridensis]|uniref:endopeptidase La n=1 Tax=Halanaerobacter jeridensis TaxID=706427 RepID=A0A938XNR2_9FIRM|nr:ATP-binding protein [Halanaerobacter jeridensis]MBM7555807.1 lon-related putative ATP-dependent protease [Halanaerobacter jeridensis]